MVSNWKEYRDETAEAFRSLGLGVWAGIAVRGVRTSHNVDVPVKFGIETFSPLDYSSAGQFLNECLKAARSRRPSEYR